MTAAGIQSFAADHFVEHLVAEHLAELLGILGNVDPFPATVVVTDSYLRPELSEWNRRALDRNKTWILVRGSWIQPWVGPVFRPGGPCYECLRTRLLGNSHVDAFIAQSVPDFLKLVRSEAFFPAAADAAASFVRMQIALKLKDAADEPINGKIAQLDLLSHICSSHVVVKRPQCPVCGQTEMDAPRPVMLQDRYYTYSEGGERRSVRPLSTWKRYRYCISPISGVVSSFAAKTDMHHPAIHSYATGHSFPVTAGSLAELRGNMHYRSGGKGITDLHAKTGALCEAIERYSGLWRKTVPVVKGAYRDLAPEALEVNELTLFSERQFAGRREWNESCATNYQVVPNPLDPDTEIDWVPAWSFGKEKFRLIPAAYGYYGHPDLERFFCTCDSNGNAAGNTLEEAIIRGFMELVERDAVAIWWYNRLRMPGLDIRSFHDPYLNALFSYYASIGRQLWALDLTGDLGIPVAGVISRCINHKTEDIVIGFSADLDVRTALLRAVNEVGQFLPALSQRDADGHTRYFYDDAAAIHWWKTARVATESHLLPKEGPGHARADFPILASSNQRIEVETCVRVADACGIEILVLNQTQPDIGLPVVKVIAPGMRHFWNRLGPGRLYDVPVKMGYRSEPAKEEDLNPIPMFF